MFLGAGHSRRLKTSFSCSNLVFVQKGFWISQNCGFLPRFFFPITIWGIVDDWWISLVSPKDLVMHRGFPSIVIEKKTGRIFLIFEIPFCTNTGLLYQKMFLMGGSAWHPGTRFTLPPAMVQITNFLVCPPLMMVCWYITTDRGCVCVW